MTEPQSLPAFTGDRRPATPAEARALSSTIRLRILRACLNEAMTNKAIAQRLGRNPATVLHHVRILVAQGFLAPAAERRGARGAREIPYLATGKSWLMEVGETASRHHMLAAFLEEVAAVGETNLDSSRLGLRLTESELEEFKTGLAALLDYWARRPATPGGRRWSVYVGMHPEQV